MFDSVGKLLHYKVHKKSIFGVDYKSLSMLLYAPFIFIPHLLVSCFSPLYDALDRPGIQRVVNWQQLNEKVAKDRGFMTHC